MFNCYWSEWYSDKLTLNYLSENNGRLDRASPFYPLLFVFVLQENRASLSPSVLAEVSINSVDQNLS